MRSMDWRRVGRTELMAFLLFLHRKIDNALPLETFSSLGSNQLLSTSPLASLLTSQS